MSSTMQETPKKKSRATTKRATKTTTTERRSPSHDEIAARARELFVKSGYAPGRDEEFWLEAEKQLREEITA